MTQIQGFDIANGNDWLSVHEHWVRSVGDIGIREPRRLPHLQQLPMNPCSAYFTGTDVADERHDEAGDFSLHLKS